MHRSPRVPALDRPPTDDEQYRIDGQRSCRTDHHQHAIGGEPWQHGLHRVGIRYRCDHSLGTAKLGQRLCRILRLAIDIIDRTQLPGQRFLVLATGDGNCFESHLRRELYSKMAKPADSKHRDDVAAARSTVTERIESCHSSAHQRRAVNRGQFVRHRRQRFRWCNHVLSVASVKIDSRRQESHVAGKEITASAIIAVPTISAMPANAYALTVLPSLYVFAD